MKIKIQLISHFSCLIVISVVQMCLRFSSLLLVNFKISHSTYPADNILLPYGLHMAKTKYKQVDFIIPVLSGHLWDPH